MKGSYQRNAPNHYIKNVSDRPSSETEFFNLLKGFKYNLTARISPVEVVLKNSLEAIIAFPGDNDETQAGFRNVYRIAFFRAKK